MAARKIISKRREISSVEYVRTPDDAQEQFFMTICMIGPIDARPLFIDFVRNVLQGGPRDQELRKAAAKAVRRGLRTASPRIIKILDSLADQAGAEVRPS